MTKLYSKNQKVLNIWAIILILWSFYRAFFTAPAWFDEFIAKPIIFILPLYYYIKTREKVDFFKGVGVTSKRLIQDILAGLVIGLILLSFVTILRADKNTNIFLWSQAFSLFCLSIATAISEQILSIGFVFKRLFDESKKEISSIFYAAILFLILHIPILLKIERITGGMLLMYFYMNFILIIINSIIFIRRKSLTLPILIHAFYNLSILLFY